MPACVITKGAAAVTPLVCRTVSSTRCQSSRRRPSPYVSTRRCGLPTRILSRRSDCSPFMTPNTITNAATPTNGGSSGTAARCGAPGRQSFRPEHGKENHVPDVGPVRKQHDQPVDAEAHAAGGRHAVFEGAEIVL